MNKLLYVIGSPRRSESESGKIADEFISSVKGTEIDTLDLWQEHLPEFDGNKAAAKMAVITGGQMSGDVKTAWDEVQCIAKRFTDADEYLFTVPMWNSGIPYKLKLYIDILTQPGILFGFDPATGYKGLLKGKKATVIYTSAVYAPGVPPAFGKDFHSTYFDDWLSFIGIEEIATIRFQRARFTKDYELGLKTAKNAARAAAGKRNLIAELSGT